MFPGGEARRDEILVFSGLNTKAGSGRLRTKGENGVTGAAYRTRTCDPLITNEVLYQLS